MLTAEQKKKLLFYITKCLIKAQSLPKEQQFNIYLGGGNKEGLDYLLHDGPPPTPERYAIFITDLFRGIHFIRSSGFTEFSRDELKEMQDIFVVQTKIFFAQFKGSNLNYVVSDPSTRMMTHFAFIIYSVASYLPEELIQYYADELNIDLNARDVYRTIKSGNTLLLWLIANACNESAYSILRVTKTKAYFLEMLNAVSNFKTAAIHVVVAKGYRDHDADNQPLLKSNLELLHLIIEGGADVNLQTTGAYEEGKDVELGNTALHYACARRDKDFIAYLVQHGADVTIKNGVGKTPLDMLTVSREEAKRFVDQVQPNNFSEIYRDEDAVVEEIRELLNSSPVDRNPLKVEAEDNTKQPEAIFSSDQRRLILDALAYSIKKVASNIFISDGFLKKKTH